MPVTMHTQYYGKDVDYAINNYQKIQTSEPKGSTAQPDNSVCAPNSRISTDLSNSNINDIINNNC